jgi:hypothetical protein
MFNCVLETFSRELKALGQLTLVKRDRASYPSGRPVLGLDAMTGL